MSCNFPPTRLATRTEAVEMGLAWPARYLLYTAVALSVFAGTVRADEHHRQCLDTPTMSVMYEPGVEAPAEPESPGFRFFNDGGRWHLTATDGVVEEGAPLTLTYSFLPDGTSIPGFHGEAVSPSSLFATMDANFPGGRAAWKAAFADCFNRFGELTNITYIEVADDGANFGLAGELGARGDIRIGMHPVGDGPLAYNFYPVSGGDMVLDSLDIDFFTDPAGNFVRLRNVLMHEHGHGLGLAHVLPQNGTKLMEPAANTGFDGLQEDDIRAVQHVYGDWAESNDAGGDEEFVGGPLRNVADAGEQVLTVEDLAIEREESTDWFGFTAFAGVPIAIRVEPLGSTYQFGPEDGGAPTTVDARATRDLGLRLWRRVSAQTGQLQMVAQINFNDAGEDEYHPPIPYTLAGYMLAEVYSTDLDDDVQRYRLTISNVDIPETVGDPAMSVLNGVTLVEEGDLALFPSTAVGETSGIALTIRNDGEGPLVFTGTPSRATVVGPAATDFVVGNLPAEVAPDGFAPLGISFTPTAQGERVAVLTLPNNDPTKPDFSFIIRGSATPALEAVLSVESEDGVTIPSDGTFDIGTVDVGETYAVNFKLHNTGNQTLTVFGGASLNGPSAADFAIVGGVPATMQPGAATTLALEFSPSQNGELSATLSLTHTGSNTPYRVTLTATAEGVDLLEDCNENGVEDADDIANGFSTDCDANGVPDECELAFDGDGDGVLDPCDNCPDAFNPDQADEDDNGLGDACEEQEFSDCNANGSDDLADIDSGFSEDCNANDVPDECEPDSDLDGVIDACDNCPQAANPAQTDANGNGIGDACEIIEIVDCNANGVADDEDLATGISGDCDGDGVPDECAADSDGDGVIDACDTCPGEDDFADADNDGVADCRDNCPEIFNPDQEDADADGLGDLCDTVDGPPDDDKKIGGFCGAGAVGMIPVALLGMCGMRLGSRRRHGF